MPSMSTPAKGSALLEPLVSFCLGIALISPALKSDKAFPLIEFTLLPIASAISSINAPSLTNDTNCPSSSSL